MALRWIYGGGRDFEMSLALRPMSREVFRLDSIDVQVNVSSLRIDFSRKDNLSVWYQGLAFIFYLWRG